MCACEWCVLLRVRESSLRECSAPLCGCVALRPRLAGWARVINPSRLHRIVRAAMPLCHASITLQPHLQDTHTYRRRRCRADDSSMHEDAVRWFRARTIRKPKGPALGHSNALLWERNWAHRHAQSQALEAHRYQSPSAELAAAMQWFSPDDPMETETAATAADAPSTPSARGRARRGDAADATRVTDANAAGQAVAAAVRPSQRPLGVGALPFHTLCLLLEKLERSKWAPLRPGGGAPRRSAPGRMERCAKTLDAFFNRCASLGGDPLPLLVLMLPDADLERRFDCKETTLVKLLLKGFGLARTRTAEALTKWRTGPQTSAAAAAAGGVGVPTLQPGQGDLSLTIHSLLATYAASVPTLTVAQVNLRLDSLASRSAWTDQTFKDGLAVRKVTLDADAPPVHAHASAEMGAADESPDSPAQLIFQLYSRCTSLEHKWLTRIILRDLGSLSSKQLG